MSINKILPNTEEYNTEIDKRLVKKTKLLRKSYVTQIKAKTKPGTERAITQGGGLTHLTLLDTFNIIHGKYSTNAMNQIGLNLMANAEGSILANRELLYWVEQNDVFVSGKGFIAIEVLERLQTAGVLEKHSDYNRHEGVAREAKVKQKRNLSTIAVEILSYYIEETHLQITKDILSAYEIEDNNIYWPDDPAKQEASETLFQEKYLSKEIVLYRRRNVSLVTACRFKDAQNRMGMSLEFIKHATDLICPGYQEARKEKITTELCKRYNINQQGDERLNETLELAIHKDNDGEDGDGSPPNKYPGALDVSPTSVTLSVPCPTTDSFPYSYLRSVDPSFSLGALRDTAADIMVKDVVYVTECFNDALTQGVISYVPKDPSDARQQSIMLSSGCLPAEYKLLSPSSPRVYSSQADNLFYCRKEMRLQAMEGLGFMDVDLQNCHVEFVLALWGDMLPTLKAEMDKGSLWDYYREYLTSNGVPFYKGFIKSLHHATFLTGGKNAYRLAWHRYNNQHPDALITKDEYDTIVQAFIKCPVCLELKALFTHLKKEWVGKVMTVPTGESFRVEDTNWALLKKIQQGKGKYARMDESEAMGNFPTALAALLQSLEVSLLSYLIVRCEPIFVPILWQHDGLTIKALYTNTLELMQSVVDDFCRDYLGGRRYLKLIAQEI